MIQVFQKEVSNFLNSLTAYIVITVFLTTVGLLMWIFPDTSVLSYGYAEMETLFRFGPYVLMFLAPAITMRMFAEEKKNGTLEILLTQPLTETQVILGKYLAGVALMVVSILPTMVYYFSLYQLGNPQGNIDSAGIMGSYIGLILLGGVFTAIGLFSSSLTENQVVAFLISMFLCFILYDGFHSLSLINVWNRFSRTMEKLSLTYYYNDLSRGLINFSSLVYLISVCAFMILLTRFNLGIRKW